MYKNKNKQTNTSKSRVAAAALQKKLSQLYIKRGQIKNQLTRFHSILNKVGYDNKPKSKLRKEKIEKIYIKWFKQ